MLRLYLIFLSLLSAALIFAQHPHYYQIDDRAGLPSNEVYYLLQDSNRLVWIGTSAGLFNYDGSEFKSFKNSNQNSRAVSNIRIDVDGKVWCQNFSGQLFYVDGDSLHYASERSIAQSNYPVYTVDENGDFYISSDSGIYVFKKSKKQFLSLANQDGKLSFITDVLCNNGRVYYAARERIGYFENGKLSTIIKSNRPAQFSDLYKQSFFEVVDGKVVVLAHGANKNSIWQFSNDSLLWLRDLPAKLDRVFALHKDNAGHIWVGSSNGALCLDENLNDLYGGTLFFSSKSISDVVADAEGNYWFSTLQDGIFIVPSLNVWIHTAENSELPDTRIRQLTKDGNSNLFIGFQNGKVSKYNQRTSELKTIAFPNSHFEIQELYFDSTTQQLYVAQNNFWNVNVENLSTSFLKNGDNIKSFFRIDKQYFFAGTVNDATIAVVRNNEIDRISNFRKKRVRCAKYEESMQRLWVGYSDGLFVYENGNSEELRLEGKPIFATDILLTEDKKVWVSTMSQGVIAFNQKQVVEKLNEVVGITNGYVRKLASKADELWMTAEHHLIRYNTLSKQTSLFNHFDGLPSLEIADIEIMDGKIFLATPKGLVSLPLNMLAENKVPPVVAITNVNINNHDTTLHANYELAYSSNNIKIDFRGIAFRSRGEFTFKYRLLGLDTNWIETNSSSNFARYPSLPAGNYTFEVVAINEDGVESMKPETLQLTILKPYWQQWWFYLLAFLLFGSVLSTVFYLRIRALKKRNALEKKLANSQLSTLKAQMNPHFMFNALSSIQDLVIQQKSEKAQLYLGKFSDLTRKVLNASGNEFITLDAEIEMLSLYLELESLRFEGELVYSLNIDENLEPEEMKIPSMVIQPFVENALKHGLLHQQGKKQLIVSFTKMPDYLLCEIEDNGIGRAASAEIKKRKQHQSFATRATEERLSLLRDYYHIKIEMRIEDKTDADVASGTKVILKIFQFNS